MSYGDKKIELLNELFGRNASDVAYEFLNSEIRNPNNSTNLSEKLFQDASGIYLNPTEELVMKDVVKKDSVCATVLSSGDFALDSIFNGAREVITFDINENQLYSASLKLAAIQNVGYEDYYNFLANSCCDSFLSNDIYSFIKEKSNDESFVFEFFDIIINQRKKECDYFKSYLKNKPEIELLWKIKIMQESDNVKLRMLAKKVIKRLNINFPEMVGQFEFDLLVSLLDHNYKASNVFKCIYGLMGIKTPGSYIENERSYRKTCDSIQESNIKFIKSDLSKLLNNLKDSGYLDNNFGGFQSLYLSNIPEYLSGSVFAKIVDSQLMPLLKDDGVIVYCCQGVDKDRLNVSPQEFNFMRMRARIINDNPWMNPYTYVKEINDIQGYSYLKGKYKVSIVERDSLSPANGNDNKDSFVYVKKR